MEKQYFEYLCDNCKKTTGQNDIPVKPKNWISFSLNFEKYGEVNTFLPDYIAFVCSKKCFIEFIDAKFEERKKWCL